MNTLLAVLASVLFLVDCDPAAVNGFYGRDPSIIELKDDNWQQTLRGAQTAHLVEFYMSWCGHCRAFAPLYRRFAKSVSEWNSVVKIAAINCASDDAKATCRDQGISGVPTLKYFPAKTDENAGKIFPAFRSVTKLKAELLNRVIEENHATRIIDFRPLEENDPRILKPSKPMVAFVVDDTNSSIAFELMLELHSHPKLSVFRALPSHPWLSKVEIDEVPSIVFFKNGEPVDQAGFKSVLRSAILQYIDGVVTTHGPGFVTPTPKLNASEAVAVTDAEKFFASENDMLLAVKEMLESEVPFKSGVFTNKQVLALENFLEGLKENFPTQTIVTLRGEPRIVTLKQSTKAVKLFGFLLRWLKMERSLGQDVSSAKWTTILNMLKNAHGDPFPNGDWEHCKGSSENYRGYTCGLWSLFHAITVRSYIRNRNEPEWNPSSTIKVIRGYVENFFGCTYCKEHFLKMSENMTQEIKTKEDSFMWLWQAHNQVNARLAGDPTEDPAYPKRQFPPSFLCPTCKSSDGKWTAAEVKRFVLKYYSSIKPIPASYS